MDFVQLLNGRFAVEGEKVRFHCLKTYADLQRTLGSTAAVMPPADVYDYYPYLFLSAFPEVDQDKVRALAVAGHFYWQAFMKADQGFDGHAGTQWDCFCAPYFHGEAVRALSSLFPYDSRFWAYFRRFYSESLAAIRVESELSHEVPSSGIRFVDFRTISKGKYAIAKTAVVALAHLADDETPVKRLIDSHDLFAIGSQLFDDLVDWRQDLERRQISFLISQAAAEARVDLQHVSCEDVRVALSEVILGKGLCQAVLELAIDYMERSIFAVQGLDVPHWVALNRIVTARFARLYADLNRLRGITAMPRQIEGPSTNDATDNTVTSTIEKAALLLISQHAAGYPGAGHSFQLPVGLNLRTRTGHLLAEVRQRAMITRTLQDVAAFGVALSPGLLERDRKFLIEARTAPLGWSYCNELVDLPPSADDLGHILPVLMDEDTGRNALAPALAMLRESHGPVPAFFLGEADEERLSQMLRVVELMGGQMPSAEIQAQLLTALIRYGGEQFTHLVENAVTAVEREQMPEGGWLSRWYVDPYYASYTCCTFLGQCAPDSRSLPLAEQWLLQHQAPDGSWHTPQATALALLSLVALPDASSDQLEAIRRGVRYLCSSQRPDGSWQGSSLISVGLPHVDDSAAVPDHQSATVSTALVLRALIACSERL